MGAAAYHLVGDAYSVVGTGNADESVIGPLTPPPADDLYGGVWPGTTTGYGSPALP